MTVHYAPGDHVRILHSPYGGRAASPGRLGLIVSPIYQSEDDEALLSLVLEDESVLTFWSWEIAPADEALHAGDRIVVGFLEGPEAEVEDVKPDGTYTARLLTGPRRGEVVPVARSTVYALPLPDVENGEPK